MDTLAILESLEASEQSTAANSYQRDDMLKSGQGEPVDAPAYTPAPTSISQHLTPATTPNPPIQRTLHIPARGSTVLYGFKNAPILTNTYVSAEQWNRFTKEIQNLINPKRASEHTVYAILGITMTLFGGLIIFGAVTFVFYAGRKEECRRRFEDLKASGALDQCLHRWNTVYFEPQGLRVTVEPPDSSTNLSALANADVPNVRSSSKERRAKLRAAKKFRIVVTPFVPEVMNIPTQVNEA